MIKDSRSEVARNNDGKRVANYEDMWMYKSPYKTYLNGDGTVTVYYEGDKDIPVVTEE
jgi:hypothetical protein